jgi:hypothetical protein
VFLNRILEVLESRSCIELFYHYPIPLLQPISLASGAPAFQRTMASVASRRLFSEFRALSTDSPEGIVAGPVSEDDIFKWEALIQGPEGTPFEGGVLVAELAFPKVGIHCKLYFVCI